MLNMNGFNGYKSAQYILLFNKNMITIYNYIHLLKNTTEHFKLKFEQNVFRYFNKNVYWGYTFYNTYINSKYFKYI